MCLSTVLVIRYDYEIKKKLPFCTPAFSSGVQNPYTIIAELASERCTRFGILSHFAVAIVQMRKCASHGRQVKNWQ